MINLFASVFMYTLLQATLSTFFSVILALPLAHFLYRFNIRGKKFFLAVTPLLCIMPCKLVAMGTLLSFNVSGLVGIILAHCVLNIPFAFYLLRSTYQKFDIIWERTAQQLGASQWQVYRHIYLPFLKPTIQSATIIIFLLCFSSFSIPLLLGTCEYHMTPDIKISQFYTNDNLTNAGIYFLMRLIIIIPICMFYIHNGTLWTNPWRDWQQKINDCYKPKKHGYVWLLSFIIPCIIILPPCIALIYAMYKENIFSFFNQLILGNKDMLLNMPIHIVIINSFILATISSIGSVILGFIFYKLLYIIRNVHAKRCIAMFTSFSFIVGSVGYGIIASSLIKSLIFPPFIIAILCHMLLNFSFAYRIIKTQMVGWQPEWILLAQNFGATRLHRLQTLEWPFLRTSFYQAFCIAFGLSLTEVGAGSIFGNAAGTTIPMAIHIYRKHNVMSGVMGLSLVLLLFVFFLAYVINKYSIEAK